MKKYLVIGNPIDHSLSPRLHNYWFKKNDITAEYGKKKINEEDLESFIIKIKEKEIDGINVTVPFKKEIISHLDKLSHEAEITQSVNTIFLEKNLVTGHNTDIAGFELALKNINYDVKGKKIFILGAGGVVPSIIFALNKLNVSTIKISNRTKSKAEDLKHLCRNLEIVNWGEIVEFDMVINATSLGLKLDDKFNLDFLENQKNKFFYDVIYNPPETNFLKVARKLGNKTENGKKMFIYQASEAFRMWHGIEPEFDQGTFELLD